MKLILRLILSLILLMLLSVSAFSKSYRIAIFDYDIRLENNLTVAKYIEEQLQKSGFSSSEINQFTGEENDIRALKVLRELDANNYDLIITITSDSMIPAMHTIKKTPWLFTNINNPKNFGIEDPNRPGRNHSGVTYYVPVAKQIEFFEQVMGKKINKIGLIFDYSAKSRRAELAEFRYVAGRKGITYEIKLIKNEDELPNVAKQLLAEKVELIILTSSGKVYNNAELLIDICASENVPVFSVNKNGVAQGAIAALSSDYYAMVDECLIPMAKDILKNDKNPGEMPIRTLQSPLIYLNLKQAKRLNISIPEEIKKNATKIF